MSLSSTEEDVRPLNGTAQRSRYRDIPHRSCNEALKSHSNFVVKLSETGKVARSCMER